MKKTIQSTPKLKVGLLFGGKSAEHDVSIQSVKNIFDNIDRTIYSPVLIGIDRGGNWHRLQTPEDIHHVDTTPQLRIDTASLHDVDVVFPVLHGPMGEDGTIQGLLEILSIPYAGSGVLSSAITMDKDIMKRLLRYANIPTAEYVVITRSTSDNKTITEHIRPLTFPLFIKPANMGSSIGVSKVTRKSEVHAAVLHALQYDDKVLIESTVPGQEVECAILGNDTPQASLPGMINPNDDYYSYETKYHNDTATYQIPAKLPKPLIAKIQEISLKTYQALGCEGLARVDMFVTTDGKIVVNEVNAIPGFTKISLYTQLWDVSGISAKQLITQIIELALERHERKQQRSVHHIWRGQ